jgi:hypothetical protein
MKRISVCLTRGCRASAPSAETVANASAGRVENHRETHLSALHALSFRSRKPRPRASFTCSPALRWIPPSVDPALGGSRSTAEAEGGMPVTAMASADSRTARSKQSPALRAIAGPSRSTPSEEASNLLRMEGDRDGWMKEVREIDD